jgi:hypothetical protein
MDWATLAAVATGLAGLITVTVAFYFGNQALEASVRRVRRDLLPASAPPAEKEERLRGEIASYSLAQAKATFVISLTAAVVGFVFILIGLAAVLYTMLTNSNASGGGLLSQSGILGAASTVSGVITEAIAVLFFRQTDQTRQIMLNTFDRLREDRKLDEVLWFLKDKDSALGSEVREIVAALIALRFAGYMPDNGNAADLYQGVLAALTQPATHSSRPVALRTPRDETQPPGEADQELGGIGPAHQKVKP